MTCNVLFFCTGNSARSILGEVIAGRFGMGKLTGYSAGSMPAGQVNPLTLKLLDELKLPTAGLRSKSCDEFAAPGAPKMDFIFTVCDSAAGEACPYWPGAPVTAHWGFADPSHVQGDDATRRAAFAKTAQDIAHRLRLFLSLPLDKLDRLSLQHEVRAIGAGA